MMTTARIAMSGHRRQIALAHLPGVASRGATYLLTVPILDEADLNARRCVRERTKLVSKRIELANRIDVVLATLGIEIQPLLKSRLRRLADLRTGLGAPIRLTLWPRSNDC